MPRRHRRPHAGGDEDTPIEEQVRRVIAVSFDLDEDDLPVPLSREAVAGWTSSSQMTLLLNLERRFGVSFSLEQMVTMTSAKRIAEVVRTMIAAEPNR